MKNTLSIFTIFWSILINTNTLFSFEPPADKFNTSNSISLNKESNEANMPVPPPLSGVYSISTTGDYQTFSAAIIDLIAIGVDDSVVFSVAAGTYNEQLTIPEIAGVSDTIPIVFQSASGERTDVVLSFASTLESENYTLKLDGADHIVFKNITLKATGATYARIVEFGSEANANTFVNNQLIGVINTSELVYSSTTYDSSNVFSNNVFQYGINGIDMTSGRLTEEAPGISVTGNEFIDQTGIAIALMYYDHPIVTSNYIHSEYECRGIQLDAVRNKNEIGNNRILLSNGGIGIDVESSGTGVTNLIYNNFIYVNASTGGNPDYGIAFFYGSDIGGKVVNNTVHITGDNTSSACLSASEFGSFTLQNNNLVNKAKGYVYHYNGSGITLYSDYNNLFTNGLNITQSTTDLNQWQSIHEKDLNSISVDPFFLSDTDYMVQNPMLNGSGTPIAEVTHDIAAELRDETHPDIGVVEFTPSPVPLQGTFTIGGGSPDYVTINEAVRDLTINGVSGETIFEIASGTYNEQVVFQEISGASETNTITFQSATGDSTDVVISYTPNTTNVYTLLLDGADYFTFKNLSITNAEEWGRPVELRAMATHNTFEGNKIYSLAPPTQILDVTSIYDYALIYAKDSGDSSNLFTGNYLTNASIGILLENSGSENRIEHNVMDSINFKGIYMRGSISPVITGNSIDVSSDFKYCSGINLFSSHSDGNSYGLIANNMIRVTGNTSYLYGILLYTSSELTVVHNTIKISGQENSEAFHGDGNHFNLLNNMLVVSAGSWSATITDTTGCSLDYNLYSHPNVSYAGLYLYSKTANLEQYGYDLHSFVREPEFLAETDLHTHDPWISNRGIPLAEVAADIDGESRDPAHPDVGADEYEATQLFEGYYLIGSQGHFQTFTAAVDSIMQIGAYDSVTFFVESGVYNEQFTIGEIPYIADSITVTFKPEIPGDTVTLEFKGSENDNYLVKLDGADYITFEGITFRALDSTYSNIIEITNGAIYNRILDNIFVGSSESGSLIYSSGSQDDENWIKDNAFYEGAYGIYLAGAGSGNKAQGLVIDKNYFESQKASSTYLDYQSGATFSNNQVFHPEMIEDKWVGVYVANSTGTSLFNNAISYTADQLSGGIVLSGSDQTNIFYNSVYIAGEASDSRCVDLENGSTNNSMINNVLVNNAGGIAMYNTDISSFTSDYNNLYSNEKLIYTTEWYSDLAAWQVASGNDLHSTSANPQFVSLTNLHSKSPLLNGTGNWIDEIALDQEGNKRDNPYPDLGAYEFSEVEFYLGPDSTICNNTFMMLDAGSGYDAYSWNTGADTQTIETSLSDKADTWYGVTVTINGTAYTDSVKVTHIGPTVNLGDTTAFCPGESITLIAGNESNSYLWSTGSIDPGILVNTPGEYTVKVTDTQGCFEHDTIYVIASTPPDVDLGADTTFCPGGLFTLDAGAGDEYAYIWSDESFSQSIEVTDPGHYEVVVFNKYGCSNSDQINLSLSDLPTIDLANEMFVCEGGEITIDAGSGFNSYMWSDGSQQQSLTTAEPGKYYVTVSNTGGCSNSDTVLVKTYDLIVVTLSGENDELWCDYEGGTSYTWYLNGVETDINGPTYSSTQSGEYHVDVVDENGCISSSNTVTVTLLGVENTDQVFHVYPNPSNGYITIHFEEPTAQVSLGIYSMDGKKVYGHTIHEKLIIDHQVVLLDQPAGIYLLKVHIQGKTYTYKIYLGQQEL